MDITQKDIKNKRQIIFSKSQKTTIIKKGDKRIASATRICAICGRKLSSITLNTGAVIATTTHVSCKISDLIRINMCADIRSCYAYTKQKEDN